MDNHDTARPGSTLIMRWIARGLSVTSLGVILLFAVGEGFNPGHISPKEWVLFLFFPFGVAGGLLAGWWKENIGAAITLLSLTMFYLVHFFYRGIFPHGWALLVFSSPGFLFLLCWYRSRNDHRTAA